MLTSTAIYLSLMAGTVSADLQPIDVPAADVAAARELVKQLADPKFKIRDAAEKQLIDLGLVSLNALKEGEKSADLHVQDRCRVLQPIVRGAIALKKKVDGFLANKDGTLPKDLPFVGSFIKITDDSKEARALYAELLYRNAPMLDDAERDKKKGSDLFAVYCQEVAQRMNYVPGVDMLAHQKSVTKADIVLYFLLSRELPPDNTGRVSSYGHSFMNAPVLKETLTNDTTENLPFKKMFLAWMEKEPQPYMVQRGLQIAVDAKMKEALPFVLKHIRDKNVPIYTRAQTALLMTKVGTKEHIKDIEPMLNDKTVVGNFGINNVQGQVQMRDIALAVCIKLTGQKMVDYDFDVMKGNEEMVYMSYIYCAFSSNDKREAAHMKYKEFQHKEAKK